MSGWAALAVYAIVYDVTAARRGRPTLSAHARRLDTAPHLRALAAAAGLVTLDHLVGTRRIWR